MKQRWMHSLVRGNEYCRAYWQRQFDNGYWRMNTGVLCGRHRLWMRYCSPYRQGVIVRKLLTTGPRPAKVPINE